MSVGHSWVAFFESDARWPRIVGSQTKANKFEQPAAGVLLQTWHSVVEPLIRAPIYHITHLAKLYSVMSTSLAYSLDLSFEVANQCA